MTSVELPIRLESEANVRQHWAQRHRRAASQRDTVRLLLPRLLRDALPVTITLTRIAPRILDDDNAVRSLKAVRDEIAALYGVDDRDPRITWRYGQERRPKCYAVKVEIISAGGVRAAGGTK